jgi:hypothetical protein
MLLQVQYNDTQRDGVEIMDRILSLPSDSDYGDCTAFIAGRQRI